MQYDVRIGDHGLRYDPFKALVGPRPIGWITTLDAMGRLNCSPYSYFTILSDRPHMVGFSAAGDKDSRAFAEETGEFTCSFSCFGQRNEMNQTATPLARGESEFDFAAIEAEPSRFVKPPRVKGAPAALECKWVQSIPMVGVDGQTRYALVIGQVVGIYIDDAFIEDGIVDTGGMQPVMRAGYDEYFVVGPEQMFKMDFPPGVRTHRDK
ncbi:flavin reductase family protein [Enterovirga rhinocerotis]|uniref:Flavin reductase (DIM6/NTAB) family NADH-FMN oxidoreductase RutF n=1 Tax=Enterovirga rhinocerotis TaxID=1339210 RepID=A0A4R7C3D3_9HYPH|nr:flavin reductase family protein [Enterovirga rhinocerotis]TDR92908.1 flavin reductase (DIM6/NTAB) family NADH-FMN oxidoreductase RutF [Enterovirga rhinocerotis]